MNFPKDEKEHNLRTEIAFLEGPQRKPKMQVKHKKVDSQLDLFSEEPKKAFFKYKLPEPENKEKFLGLESFFSRGEKFWNDVNNLPKMATLALSVRTHLGTEPPWEDLMGNIYRTMDSKDIIPFIYSFQETKGFYSETDDGIKFLLNSEYKNYVKFLNNSVVNFVYSIAARGHEMMETNRKVEDETIRNLKKFPREFGVELKRIYDLPIVGLRKMDNLLGTPKTIIRGSGNNYHVSQKEHNGDLFREMVKRYFNARSYENLRQERKHQKD